MSYQIALPTVDQFSFELESVGAEWYDLGIFLSIPTHKLDVIGEYHGSKGTRRCLIEVFKSFQSRTKPVTWNDITDALTKIHNNYLAGHIRDKYIRTVSSSPPSSVKQETGSDTQVMEIVSHTQPLPPRETEMETNRVSEIYDHKRIYIDKSIIKEFNEIITSFASLVLEIRRVVQKKSVSMHELQVVLQEIYELEPFSTEEATLERVFAKLRQHYCFLNYHILAYLVDKFLSNEKPLQQLLENYTNKLEKFKKSTKIKHLMKLIKETRDLCGNHKIVELKTRDFWGNVTLKKFDRLANLIFENLYDCAAHIRIKDGCICISWVIPDIDTSVLVTVSPDVLKVVGVISLKIDDKVLYEGPNEGCHMLESAFLQAVELGNVRAVELLLAVGCDTNIHTYTGELAITSAVQLKGSKGFGVFHLACLNGHTDVVSILLAAGSSLEVTTNSLMTPLMMGSWNGHSVVVSTLLKSGADPNKAESSGGTSHMIGSQNGHNEIVELLLKAKVNPNACSKDGTTALFLASQNGHSVVVSTLLTSGADPNVARNDGGTPLMVGSKNGHNEVVELLLKAKGNPNISFNDGATALFLASQNGHSVVVIALLKSGADPNLAKSSGGTPLTISSEKGHNEVVELLLKAKVNPNACLKNGTTAIYIASQNGHSVVVITLLKSGADPNMARSNGSTPLMIGSENGHNEVVELLLKAKVNSNACLKNGVTAINLASCYGHSVVVSTLLKSGADPNTVDNDGWTPLMIGSQNGHNEVVELLLKANVNPDGFSKDGTTSIYIATQNGHSVVVSTLLASGADPNMADKDGWSPLMVGSQNGHNEVVELLLKANVNPNGCSKDKVTALFLGCQNGHFVVVVTLLKAGADPNLAKSSGGTPLMIASEKGHNAVVELLMKTKVNPNACNSNGATALFAASQNGHSVVVSNLLKFGADPNIGRRTNGWTPLMIASAKGHTEVVKQLIEHGDNYQAVAGVTALHLASQYGHIDIVRILLESGADSRLVNSEGKSPLDFASLYDIVKLFYESRPFDGLRSILQRSLAGISSVDTGYYGSEHSGSSISELSGYSASLCSNETYQESIRN